MTRSSPRPGAARSVGTSTLLAVLAVSLGALWVGAAAPVGAHGDEGEMEITRLSASGDRIEVEVGVRYADDGHLAEDARVEATAIGPDGRRVGPVELNRVSEDGALYAGEVRGAGPGTWAVEVDSTAPAASTSGSVDVRADPAAGTTPAEGGSDTTTPAAPQDESATDDPQEATPAPVSVDGDPLANNETGGDGLPVIAFVAAVAAVVVTGGALTVVRRREAAGRSGSDAGGGAGRADGG